MVLAASPVGAELCLTHFVPQPPCAVPNHRVAGCDNFLGAPPNTAGLSVGACNSTAAVLARQQWSCLNSVDCAQPSLILAVGSPGCERLAGYVHPPTGVQAQCCLTYLASGVVQSNGSLGAGFGLQQCWGAGMSAELAHAQHFSLLAVAGGGSGGGGPVRHSLQLAGIGVCLGALEPGYALPRTLALYQNWTE